MHASKTGLIAVLLMLCGCQKPPAPPPQQAKQPVGENKPILNVDSSPSAAMHFQAGKQVQRNKNDFAQLAMFYIQYETENNRAPANWEEFKAAMGREAPNLVKLVESGDVVINYNVKPSSNTVLVYEKNPNINKIHLTAFGDKRVEQLTPEQLQQALQAR
jgi:hypothetical protein